MGRAPFSQFPGGSNCRFSPRRIFAVGRVCDLRGTAVHGPLRHPLGVVVPGSWIVGVDFAAKYGFENAATKQRIFSGRHNFADSLLNESHVFVSQQFLVAEDIGSLNRGDGVIFPHTLQIGMSVGCSRGLIVVVCLTVYLAGNC